MAAVKLLGPIVLPLIPPCLVGKLPLTAGNLLLTAPGTIERPEVPPVAPPGVPPAAPGGLIVPLPGPPTCGATVDPLTLPPVGP